MRSILINQTKTYLQWAIRISTQSILATLPWNMKISKTNLFFAIENQRFNWNVYSNKSITVTTKSLALATFGSNTDSIVECWKKKVARLRLGVQARCGTMEAACGRSTTGLAPRRAGRRLALTLALFPSHSAHGAIASIALHPQPTHSPFLASQHFTLGMHVLTQYLIW